LVAPGDVDALAAAMEPLLANPESAVQMGARGREKALTRHDIAREAADIVAVYEKILGVSF